MYYCFFFNFSVYVYDYVHRCASAHRGQKETLDHLELELQKDVNHLMQMLRIELCFSDKETYLLLTAELSPQL